MSVSNVAPSIMAAQQGATTPNLLSLVSGEIFKIMHNRGALGAAIVTVVLIILGGLTHIANLDFGTNFTGIVPDQLFYQEMLNVLNDARSYDGLFLMILTVIVIGLEYQQGTIRVLLARGVGRMRLLTAKLLAIFTVGLGVLVGALILGTIMIYIDYLITGHSDIFGQAPDYLWSDIGTYLLTIILNMVATILLAAAITTLGRTLAIGLGITLPWFLVETVLTGILFVISVSSKNKFWYGLQDFFLGVNLTRLPQVLLADHQQTLNINNAQGIVAQQLGLGLTTNTTQMVLVIAAYCAVLGGAAYFMVWKRDVNQ